jgi:signal transduction histidine kinase
MQFATDQERALADLLVRAMNAREREGARIARILHDEIGQVLSAIGLQLDLLRMDIAENPAQATGRIGDVQKVIEAAVAQVRDLSYELNPCIVERSGLPAALDRLVGRYRKIHQGAIRLLFDSSVRVPVHPATAFYKIAEQALDNAVCRSGADHIAILVKPSKGAAVIEIRDNGKGFLPDRESTGLGMRLMKYYAEEAGLQFSVASAHEKGTIVRAIFRAEDPTGNCVPVAGRDLGSVT